MTDQRTIPVGVVAIGRNEGQRLHRCLESLVGRAQRIVYVDSGSTDDSVTYAQELGVEVVLLDQSKPFTAARARNAGLDRLRELEPSLEIVQFVDGDCEVAAKWLELGHQTLQTQGDIAVVCGRRRELNPKASVYNQLSDMEWDAPSGETNSFGGDAMIRVEPFVQVGGYDPTMIAGEDPDLSFRLREQGQKILRLDADMTWHDAAMTRFSQWWKRSLRSGYVYADGAVRHGRSPERYCVRQARSNWVWGLIVPVVIGVIAWLTGGWGLVVIGVYPLMLFKIVSYRRGRGDTTKDSLLYGLFCLIGKTPQMLGQIKYWWGRWSGKQAVLIEYNQPVDRASSAIR